jgi:hypothetical protein
VGKDPQEIGLMGYLDIKPGHYYDLKNNGDQDALIFFTRYAAPLTSFTL